MAKKTALLQPPKGFRDFLPQEASRRRQVLEKMIGVFERFAFEPLETPTLEYASVLEGKYGEEERLIFSFEDRGGRRLALRFDQTVPLARVIAQHSNELPMPFKRYQIQANWRAEKPQAGRFREFVQCDFDIIGTPSPLADAEILAVTNAVLSELGFKKFFILYNDRRVLTDMIKKCGIAKEQEEATIRILDKLEKIDEPSVIEELEKAGIAKTKIEALMSFIGRRPLLPGQKKSDISLDPINEVTSLLKSVAVPRTRVMYTPTLARGLNYYTGMIMEVAIDGYEAGSVGGGGRYDGLLGMFSGQSIPAVGFSFGLDRLIEAMQTLELFPPAQSGTRVLVTIFNEKLSAKSAEVANLLRDHGINTSLYLNPTEKLDKQIKYADKKSIPVVVIVGPQEAQSGSATVKYLKTGMQETVPLADLPQLLQK